MLRNPRLPPVLSAADARARVAVIARYPPRVFILFVVAAAAACARAFVAASALFLLLERLHAPLADPERLTRAAANPLPCSFGNERLE